MFPSDILQDVTLYIYTAGAYVRLVIKAFWDGSTAATVTKGMQEVKCAAVIYTADDSAALGSINLRNSAHPCYAVKGGCPFAFTASTDQTLSEEQIAFRKQYNPLTVAELPDTQHGSATMQHYELRCI